MDVSRLSTGLNEAREMRTPGLSTTNVSDENLVVDVPRFELGNRNAERIRCFILGFQVAERLAAWNNTRYGGGL